MSERVITFCVSSDLIKIEPIPQGAMAGNIFKITEVLKGNKTFGA